MKSKLMTFRPCVAATGSQLGAQRAPLLLLTLFSLVVAVAMPATGQQQASEAASVEPPPEWSSAIASIETGDIDAAISSLESLRDRDEADDVVLATLGGLYLQADRNDEALEVLAPVAQRQPNNAAVLYNAGRAAMRNGRGELAAQLLERSLDLEPTSPALREFGLLLSMAGQVEEAYIYLRPWVLANPQDDEARRVAALGAVRLERVPDAKFLLAELPEDDPGIRLLRGQVAMIEGDPFAALGFLEPVAENPPEALAVDLARVLARAYLAVGEAEKAIEALESVVQSEGAGADPGLSVQLADAYFQAGRVEESIAQLQPYAEPLLAAPPPENPSRLATEVLFEYGRLLQSAGRPADAVPFLRLASELDPERKQVWQTFGQALAAIGQRAEAKAALEKFTELNRANEDDVSAVNQLEAEVADPTLRSLREASELALADRLDQGLALLAEEAAIAPEDPRPVLLASRLLLQGGRSEEALGAIEQLLTVRPDLPDARYQRGAVLMALDRLDEAEESFERTLAVAPEHPPALSDYSILLMSRGKKEEARPLVERLMMLRPDDAEVMALKERLDGS